MAERSKELLRFEHEHSLSSLETSLLFCNDSSNKNESNTQTNRLLPPLPPLTNILKKVQDFLPVLSEANKQLEHDAKDHPENYDIEKPTENGSKVIEMDLMLGVVDLQTPEALAAAESAISSSQPVISLAADGSKIDSEEESSADDDDNGDGEIDGNIEEHDYEN